MLQYVSIFLVGLVIVLIALSVRNIKSSRRPQAVLDNLEQFIREMEEENDRFVDMVSHLRKKMDEENLSISNRITGIANDYKRLADRISRLERMNMDNQPVPDEAVVLREPPSFLSPKYQEVARLLIEGKDTQVIAKELGVGRGEVDFVARLLESESDGQ